MNKDRERPKWYRTQGVTMNTGGSGPELRTQRMIQESNYLRKAPGVYCLRTNLADWNEETLWRTYTMLTDLESVFRSLKSELGLRPIYHRKEERVNGHIFITLIAYHLVQTLRYQLKAEHINDSWQTIRPVFFWRVSHMQQAAIISIKCLIIAKAVVTK